MKNSDTTNYLTSFISRSTDYHKDAFEALIKITLARDPETHYQEYLELLNTFNLIRSNSVNIQTLKLNVLIRVIEHVQPNCLNEPLKILNNTIQDHKLINYISTNPTIFKKLLSTLSKESFHLKSYVLHILSIISEDRKSHSTFLNTHDNVYNLIDFFANTSENINVTKNAYQILKNLINYQKVNQLFIESSHLIELLIAKLSSNSSENLMYVCEFLNDLLHVNENFSEKIFDIIIGIPTSIDSFIVQLNSNSIECQKNCAFFLTNLSALNYDPDIFNHDELFKSLAALIKEGCPYATNALANMVLSHETQNKFGSIEGLIPALITNLQADYNDKGYGNNMAARGLYELIWFSDSMFFNEHHINLIKKIPNIQIILQVAKEKELNLGDKNWTVKELMKDLNFDKKWKKNMYKSCIKECSYYLNQLRDLNKLHLIVSNELKKEQHHQQKRHKSSVPFSQTNKPQLNIINLPSIDYIRPTEIEFRGPLELIKNYLSPTINLNLLYKIKLDMGHNFTKSNFIKSALKHGPFSYKSIPKIPFQYLLDKNTLRPSKRSRLEDR